MPVDYYEMLGVSSSASKTEIRRAFVKLARSLHPDVNPDPAASERFKHITEAYDAVIALADDDGKSSTSSSSQRTDTHPEYGTFSVSRRGEDIQITLLLSLQDTFVGVERDITIATTEVCDSCRGKGYISERLSASICEMCLGTGVVFGTARCPMCGGSGGFGLTRCKACEGEGRHPATRSMSLQIPAGISAGKKLHFPADGNAGIRGGEAGDLDVTVKIKPDRFFTREGDDLICALNVSMSDAILGYSIHLASFDGDINVVIKPGAQSGDIIVFPDRGFPHYKTGVRGDLRVVLNVSTPKGLTPKERQMIEWFRDIRSHDTSGVVALSSANWMRPREEARSKPPRHSLKP